MRDQEPIEDQRLDELPRVSGSGARRIGCSLVVVICLVGSVIAVPIAKRNYTIKAQELEGVSLTYSVRSAVEVYVEDRGKLPGSNEDAGLPPASEISGKYVSQIGIADGKIIVVYGKNVDERVFGKTIVFIPVVSKNLDVSWTCSSPDLPDKWLTAVCQSD